MYNCLELYSSPFTSYRNLLNVCCIGYNLIADVSRFVSDMKGAGDNKCV